MILQGVSATICQNKIIHLEKCTKGYFRMKMYLEPYLRVPCSINHIAVLLFVLQKIWHRHKLQFPFQT